MKLGAFSNSLAVQDIQASKTFYESLGFKVFAGNLEQSYLIMKNGDTLIGLFQGMFEQNIMTFNPGWDQSAQEVNPFDAIRTIQATLQAKGIDVENPVDQESSGPASMMITDPDGNTILIDQHR